MYSVILMAAFTVAPDTPEAIRRGNGCQSQQFAVQAAPRAAGCSGGVAAAQATGCSGGVGGARIAPLRNALERRHERVAARASARAARHSRNGGETTAFFPATATYQTAPVPTCAAPAFSVAPSCAVIRQRTVVRSAPLLLFRSCPNGRCPN